ncbi:MAG: hypothetical protein JSS49_08580 [Planctomycetes bacterium]|nr:hypothetical protein [Planctomycetota bacterium]
MCEFPIRDTALPPWMGGLRSQRIFVIAIVLTAVLVSTARAQDIPQIFLMDREPAERPLPSSYFIHPELIPMWRQALSQPESELQRQAAEALVEAHALGHDGMRAAVPELLAVLKSKTVHPAARHAAAHALIALDVRSAADRLFEASQDGGKDLRQLIEPALANWDFELIRPVWRQRVQSITTPRRDLILAIRGLGQQRDAQALKSLLGLALTPENSADIRLAAARAAGQIAPEGLETQAETLIAARNCVLNRLCAVALITRHTSERAIALNQSLGMDAEPGVAVEALRSLFALDPRLVLPLAEMAINHPDAGIRRIGIETYVTLPTPERMQTLSARLNDPHPQLRKLVRDKFLALSQEPTLEPTIRQSTIAVLAGDDWRGQEQASLLLGDLDEESVTARLLELLDSARPEVMLAAAMGLKSIAAPDSAMPVLAFAQRRTEAAGFTPLTDTQLAHLFELLGLLKTTEAMPLMEIYIPKTRKYRGFSRAAAIWALGLMQEGQTNERLASQLLERATDTRSSPAEDFYVRRASVLTLGRLRASPQLPGLKSLIGDQIDNNLMDLTVRWSILQITGEALPMRPPHTMRRTGWFLEPLPREKQELKEPD